MKKKATKKLMHKINDPEPVGQEYVTQDGLQASLTQTTDAAFDIASKAPQAKHTVLASIPKALD